MYATTGDFKRPNNKPHIRLISRSVVTFIVVWIAAEMAPCQSTDSRLAIGRGPGEVRLTDHAYDHLRPSRVPTENLELLVAGKPVLKKLKGGGTDRYGVRLDSGEYLHLVVDQRGIDVVVGVADPAGKKIMDVDSPNGMWGPEPVFLLASSTGTFTISVVSQDKGARAGMYEARVEEERPATERDRWMVEAHRLSAEALRLKFTPGANFLKQSVDEYNDSIGYWRKLGDRVQEADSLRNIGEIFNSLGENDQAISKLKEALAIGREVGDKGLQGIILSDEAVISNQRGENDRALALYQESLKLTEEAGDRDGVALRLYNMGKVYLDMGDLKKSLEFYNRSLPVFREVGDKEREGFALAAIGAVYANLGDAEMALDYFEQSRHLFKDIGNVSGESESLNNLGAVEDNLGEEQKAIDYLTEALKLRRRLGNKRGQANTLMNLARARSNTGDDQAAIDSLTEAIQLWQGMRSRSGEANALINLAGVYIDLGQYEVARNYLNQAIAGATAAKDRRAQASAYNDLGSVCGLEGRNDEAAPYYSKALDIAQAAGVKIVEIYALGNLADIAEVAGQYEKALSLYNQALSLAQGAKRPRRQARLLEAIGKTYYATGDIARATSAFKRALDIAVRAADPATRATALYWTARIDHDVNKDVDAEKNARAALALFEGIREGVVSPKLRASYFATVQQAYDLEIGLLLELDRAEPGHGYSTQALEFSERARARSLLDLLTEAGANIRKGVEPALIQREQSLERRVDARATLQLTLKANGETARADQISQDVDRLTAELEQVNAEIKEKSPAYAELRGFTPIGVEQIQQSVLDQDTLLLEYRLGENGSYLWVVDQKSVKWFNLPKAADITDVAREYYNLVCKPDDTSVSIGRTKRGRSGASPERDKAAKLGLQLSRILLAPGASELGRKRLLIVADGILQYIPFAALPEPSPAETGESQPLVVRHELVSAPSVSALLAIRTRAAHRTLPAHLATVFADPVFSVTDVRVTQLKTGAIGGQLSPVKQESEGFLRGVERAAKDSGLGTVSALFPRLIYSRSEADGICRDAGHGRCTEALDFAASYKTATDPHLADYRYVHFATHALVDSVHPELSGIVLSLIDDAGHPEPRGFLRLNDVYNLRLNADLVTLSGCETALGRDVRGEGLIGLVRGFMYAGATRVAASLWQVNDKATAELMRRFYANMLIKKMSPSSALRGAQISMLQQRRYRSPYFWAGFELQGDWR